MCEKLEIQPNGKLVKTEWCTDRLEYYSEEISQYAYRHLFDNCVLAKTVTLKDVFLILNKNLSLFDKIFGNWCEDLVKEALYNSSLSIYFNTIDPSFIFSRRLKLPFFR